MLSITQSIAKELSVAAAQVDAAIQLLDEGSTVPFISRYRKEATGGLSDTDLRTLEERLRYLRELEERRASILKTISDQEKLTPELEKQIKAADTKTRLEDLYLPYKQKRRTKAQIAREAGLEPLAHALRENPDLDPQKESEKYFNAEHKIEDTKAALDGAKQILMEEFSEDADLLEKIRTFIFNSGIMKSAIIEEKKQQAAKFSDYFEHNETLKTVPSHRALAMFRGRKEGFLQVNIDVPRDEDETIHPCENMIAEHFAITFDNRPADTWMQEVVRWTWRIKLLISIESELLTKLRMQSEEEAINVFGKNLKHLLMAAPAGKHATLALDPGLRTGVKVAVVDATGKFLDHATIYPHVPKKQWDQSIAILAALCKKHNVSLISIGNGTASRETDKLAGDLLKKHKDIKAEKIIVSEAGASIYSASEFASNEFPDLDVSIRGAVSIARRLQDPLAELVKIEPKAIGVGQYQHDVNQTHLARALDAVVEDCVNHVGVDVNTASAPLLARISGLNQTIANNIVTFRDKTGPFSSREALKQIPRLGDKTFEQAAGFLRIMDGANPLDASSVHPETYPIVEDIAKKNDRHVKDLLGEVGFLSSINASDYASDGTGEVTVKDILKELEKPGRDPRPEFKAAQFKEGVEEIKDLKPSMILEGTVTNVTNFGAFIDIGVHQDGLVHISSLSNEYVKDPHDVVKTGDIVKVKVLEIDEARKRISLTMRLDDAPAPARSGSKPGARPQQGKPSGGQRSHSTKPANQPGKSGTFADLFSKKDLAKLKK